MQSQHDSECPTLTHLGWRSMPADAGDGQDRLVIRHQDHTGELHPQAMVEFLDEALHDQSAQGQASKNAETTVEFMEVQDSVVEAPLFLWGAEEGEDDPLTPAIVFSATTSTSEITGDATIFS
jgi:hypothetical protein